MADKAESSGEKKSRKKQVKIADIPHTPSPNALSMAGGKEGAERPDVGEAGSLESTPLRDPTAVDEQFPTAALATKDKRDEIMDAKMELQGPLGDTPFGKLQAKDSDFQWLQKKREQEAYANFQQWFATNFDRMSPEQKALARELFPRFYQERLEELQRQLKMTEKLARLKIEGIKDKNDLILQYAAESGFIDSDPMEHILHPERAEYAQRKDAREARYMRGLLNPRRLARGDWGIRNRKTNAKQLLGRETAAFGAHPAFELGTKSGFSAYGKLDSNTEKFSQPQGLLQQVDSSM